MTDFKTLFDNKADTEENGTFATLKPGHYIFYYERYKIHKLTVKTAQIENFVETYYDYKYEKRERTKSRFFITTEEGVNLDMDPDIAEEDDTYQYGKPFFATFTAASNYLDERIAFCEKKIANAQATIKKYTKFKENYEHCKSEHILNLTFDIYKQIYS